jgi:hypothetical protein
MNQLLHLHFDVSGDLREQARECEAEVFLSAFGNTADQLDEEYGPYDAQSFWIAVADDDGYVHGACRLIEDGPVGLKTLNDLSRQPWGVDGYRSARAAGIDPAHAWDLATAGVRPGSRRRGAAVAFSLYHAMVAGALNNRIPWVISILDDPIRRILNSVDYLMPMLPGVGSAPYLGSPSSSPVYGGTDVVDRQARVNPTAYRLLTLGIGIDGVALPSNSSLVRTPGSRVDEALSTRQELRNVA